MILVASLSERLLTAWIAKTREKVLTINMILLLLLQFLKDKLFHFDIKSDFIRILQCTAAQSGVNSKYCVYNNANNNNRLWDTFFDNQ